MNCGVRGFIAVTILYYMTFGIYDLSHFQYSLGYETQLTVNELVARIYGVILLIILFKADSKHKKCGLDYAILSK